MENEVVNVYLDRRQFDDLMGLIGASRHEVPVATGTRARVKEMNLYWGEQGGAFARMALFGHPVCRLTFGLCVWAF